MITRPNDARAVYIHRVADAILDEDEPFVNGASDSELAEAIGLIEEYLGKDAITWTSTLPTLKTASASTKA